MYIIKKYPSFLSFLFLTVLWSSPASAIPTQAYCCDPCTTEIINCSNPATGGCSAAGCAAWRPMAIFNGQDANTCVSNLNGCYGPATPTPLPAGSPTPTYSMAPPTNPNIFATPAPSGTPTSTIVIDSPTTNPINFGSVQVNSSSAPIVVRIKNTGSDTAVGCSSSFSATTVFGATYTYGTCTGTLAPGATCDVGTFAARPTVASVSVPSNPFSYQCSNTNTVTTSFVVTGSSSAACTGGLFKNTAGACDCPVGYEKRNFGSGDVCRPKLPSAQFYYDPGSNYFPVCGPGRIAVAPNGSVLSISSSYTPNTNQTATYGTTDGTTPVNYPFAQSIVANPQNPPNYLYAPNSRCSCTNGTFPVVNPAPANGVGVLNSLIGSKPIVPSETFTVISSQNSTNKIDYSPVAIAKDSTGSMDGSAGDKYQSLVGSMCGCPNLNEEMVLVDPAQPSVPQGAYCRSAIVDSPNTPSYKVLVPFDPAVHDIPGKTQIINRANEPQVPAMNGTIIPRIALRVSMNKTATLPYQRRIWACSSGMVVNPATKMCEFHAEMHMCGGAVGGAAASSVSDSVSGSTPDQKFANALNKRQNCCTSVFTKGYQNFKLDCVDNTKTNYPTFDALWSSADDSSDGGQLNAVILRNAAQKPISGFYRLDGSRCNQYSEFGGTLQPARVNPARKIAGQVMTAANGLEPLGTPIPLPTGSGAQAYSSLSSLGGVPVTPEQRLECPILVRAAIKTECPANQPLPSLQTTYIEPVAGGAGAGVAGAKTRCTAAKNIFFHIQIRQLTEIAGTRTMKTSDTISSPAPGTSISVKSLIDSLNGGECADGAKRVGNQCIYQ